MYRYADLHIQLPNKPLPGTLTKLLRLKKGYVADVGCGDGVTIETIVKANLAKKEKIVGFDVDSKRLKE